MVRKLGLAGFRGPMLEAVCACGHPDDSHLNLVGPCAQCCDPPCREMWVRFMREVFTIRRQDRADPIGDYWKTRIAHAGDKRTAWIWANLSFEDREEVASTCFKDGLFDGDGDLYCRHGEGVNKRSMWCEEEYMCEVIAVYLLVPLGQDLSGEMLYLTDRFDVDPWVIRFRRLLDEVAPCL